MYPPQQKQHQYSTVLYHLNPLYHYGTINYSTPTVFLLYSDSKIINTHLLTHVPCAAEAAAYPIPQYPTISFTLCTVSLAYRSYKKYTYWHMYPPQQKQHQQPKKNVSVNTPRKEKRAARVESSEVIKRNEKRSKLSVLFYKRHRFVDWLMPSY